MKRNRSAYNQAELYVTSCTKSYGENDSTLHDAFSDL